MKTIKKQDKLKLKYRKMYWLIDHYSAFSLQQLFVLKIVKFTAYNFGIVAAKSTGTLFKGFGIKYYEAIVGTYKIKIYM